MAISDSEKLDFLWKKVLYGTSKTASAANKAGSNETVPSPTVVYSNSIWAESDSITALPPGSDTSIIKIYAGSGAIHCTNDPTAPSNQTWFATTTYNTLASKIGGFIPPTFGSNYLVKVWVGNPSGGPAARIFPDTTGEEYVFDYVSGTLTFTGTIPAGKTATVSTGTVSVSTHGVYLEVYQYIGATGGSTNKSSVVDNITARDALTSRNGDTVYVIDAGDLSNGGIATDASPGEWATYIYNDGWILTGTQDSARSDNMTSKVAITFASSGSISLGNVGNGARVVEVSVEVTSAFDGSMEMSVGDDSDNERLMATDQNDLQSAESFVTTPIYQFPTGQETEIFIYISGTATTGSANVIITYA